MSASSPQETDRRDLTIAEHAKHVAELTEEDQQLTEQNKQLEKRIKRLESLLSTKVDAASSKKPVFTENDSLGRNELGDQDSGTEPTWIAHVRKDALS